MLRILVIVLLLANAGFWAWREGWLEPLNAALGVRPEGDRDPARLALQVNPERIVPVVPAAPPSPASAAASAAEAASAVASAASAASAPEAPAPVCLEVGPYAPLALNEAQGAVQAALPATALSVRILPGGWWIAMGPYPEARLFAKKKDELRQRGVSAEEIEFGPAGDQLLRISRHDTRELAETALEALAAKRVRTARIVDATQAALRVAQADATQQQMLAGLPSAALGGKRFEPCPPEAAAAR